MRIPPAPAMRIEALSPFGSRIEDVRLDALTARDLTRLRSVVVHEGVAVVGGQTLRDGNFARFLARLGPLMFTPGEKPVPGHPDLNLVSNLGRTRPPRSVFHTDTSYLSRPPSFTALRAVELPASGGETLFANQYHAYDRLPEERRIELARLRVRHQVSGLLAPEGTETVCLHPLVRVHPETGRRALYLSTPERCTGIVDSAGRELTDGPRLIAELYAASTEPAVVYRHRWQAGDVVIWDNRCTLHRADHSQVDGPRVLHRGMCAGEPPLGAASAVAEGGLTGAVEGHIPT